MGRRHLYFEGAYRDCTQCKAHLQLNDDNFYRQVNREYFQSACKSCAKARSKQRNTRIATGVTQDQYEQMLAEQNHQCAICGRLHAESSPEKWKRAKLAVDHCHGSGVVRGLLCHQCNVALGLMQDNPGLLRAAAEYLERAA